MIKDKKTLDDNLDDFFKEENPTAEAVKSLISVKPRIAGMDSEVELKTDLSDDEIKIHTVLSEMSKILESKEEQFSTKCILSSVIEKKERKALSKDRKSREEIVAVARQPDMSMGGMGMGMDGGQQRHGFIRRFFSRKNRDIPPQ